MSIIGFNFQILAKSVPNSTRNELYNTERRGPTTSRAALTELTFLLTVSFTTVGIPAFQILAESLQNATRNQLHNTESRGHSKSGADLTESVLKQDISKSVKSRGARLRGGTRWAKGDFRKIPFLRIEFLWRHFLPLLQYCISGTAPVSAPTRQRRRQ